MHLMMRKRNESDNAAALLTYESSIDTTPASTMRWAWFSVLARSVSVYCHRCLASGGRQLCGVRLVERFVNVMMTCSVVSVDGCPCSSDTSTPTTSFSMTVATHSSE